MTTIPSTTAIVTGASAGIGAAAARMLAARGVDLVITARREERLAKLKTEIEAMGRRCEVIVGDVTDASLLDRLLAKASEMGGRLVVVNNAGFGQPGPVENVSIDEARYQFEVNVFALAELSRMAVPIMREASWGRIINVSSVLGRETLPLFGWYCASKHAVEALSMTLRDEVKQFGIEVSLIEPGPIATEFGDVSQHLLGDSNAHGPYASQIEHFRKTSGPNSENGASPEKVAKAIVHAALSRRPRVAYRITVLTRLVLMLSWLLPRRTFHWIMRKAFRFSGLNMNRQEKIETHNTG